MFRHIARRQQPIARRYLHAAAAETPVMQKDNLVIFDTTLRDGEQSPGASLNVQEKLAIAHQLSRLGVDVCEAGFPIASQGDFEAVSLIAKEVGESMAGRTNGQPMRICGLARATEKDITRAFEAVQHAPLNRIHTFLATSDIHLQYKLKISREQCIENAVAAVKFASSMCDDVEFSAEDAGRSDPAFLAQVFGEVIAAGAKTINVPDTVGFVTPQEYGALFKYLIENTPNADQAIFSTHCHNDLGLATANTLCGISNGARQAEVTINGIGERAGNTALEEIVMTLHTRPHLYPVYCNINAQQLMRSSKMVSNYTGMSVQPNKSIVGANAFAHEAGIHQDGILKHAATYEIMKPEDVGLVSSLVMGKHSGKHAFRDRLTTLGFEDVANNEEVLKGLFTKFKDLADRKKTITDADLEAIVADGIAQPEELWQLNSVFVTGGGMMPTATVSLTGPDGSVVEDAALGAGPVEAIYKAISRVVGVNIQLVDFAVKAVTEGRDSLGHTTVRIKSLEGAAEDEAGEFREERTFGGHSTHNDTLQASANAFVSAINSLLSAQKRQGDTKRVVPPGRVTAHPKLQIDSSLDSP